jgi:hypothetical protein
MAYRVIESKGNIRVGDSMAEEILRRLSDWMKWQRMRLRLG